MKSILFFVGLFLSLSLSSNSRVYSNSISVSYTNNITAVNEINHNNTFNKETNLLIKKTVTQSRVYICGGPYATKFHSRNNCRGLNNCRSDIYYYNSQQEALDNGYKYCLICWN